MLISGRKGAHLPQSVGGLPRASRRHISIIAGMFLSTFDSNLFPPTFQPNMAALRNLCQAFLSSYCLHIWLFYCTALLYILIHLISSLRRPGALRAAVQSSSEVQAPTKVKPGPTRIKKPFKDVLQTPYTAAQLALRYGFPVLKNTAKVWVAIIELSTPVGTGYSMKDVTKYCKQVRTASLSQEIQKN